MNRLGQGRWINAVHLFWTLGLTWFDVRTGASAWIIAVTWVGWGLVLVFGEWRRLETRRLARILADMDVWAELRARRQRAPMN